MPRTVLIVEDDENIAELLKLKEKMATSTKK